MPGEELTQGSHKLCFSCRIEGKGSGIRILERGRGSDYLPHGIEVVPYEYNYWGCGNWTAADLFIGNNLWFDKTKTWNNTLEGTSARLYLLLAKAVRRILCLSRAWRAAGFVWASGLVWYLLRSNFTCLLEHLVQQLFLVWTSHTRQLIAAAVEELP